MNIGLLPHMGEQSHYGRFVIHLGRTKRQSNLVEHGFDVADASLVFAGLTFTYKDDCFAYGE